MLTTAIFFPFVASLAVWLVPSERQRLARRIALAVSVIEVLIALTLWARFDPSGPSLQLRNAVAWMPSVGASYDVALDGVNLPLVLLTAVLFTATSAYTLDKTDRAHAEVSLFGLMQTGLTGLFVTQDLLLFYLFFEVSLVPMYFVIGGWGHADRRYAALKFFLYTRAASLAMLLAFLGLYLASTPHTFSIPILAASAPLAAGTTGAALAVLGMVIGFGVKLPAFPLHNWLADAHVEAPTEGSVILAGLQLKIGAYGFIRLLLPLLGAEATRWRWIFIAIGAGSIVYGALAALAQRDLKRLVAYTSISHMGFVLLATGVYASTSDPAVRQLAVSGATLQMVSHGLLTGAMFITVGIVQDGTGTREIDALGSIFARTPALGAVMAVLAFGSLGLPGLSGFVAEFQVLGAAISVSVAAAIVAIVGVILSTGVYLRVVSDVLMKPAREGAVAIERPAPREVATGAVLALLSIVIGIAPSWLIHMIEPAALAFASR